MTGVKRLHDRPTPEILLSYLHNQEAMTDWKMPLQKAIDKVVSRFVTLPLERQTGLKLLQLIGEAWRGLARNLSIPKHIFEQISLVITQQLLKNLVHNYHHMENHGYQEINDIKGHVIINQEGRRQFHVFLLDESLPQVCKVYEWYLTVHANNAEGVLDDIIVHFLLEEKKITFSAPRDSHKSTED